MTTSKDTACDPTQNADLAAIVMQEGLGHLCLVTSCMTLVKAKIETNIPRKRKGMCGQHDKGLMKFFDQMIQAVRRHVNFEIVKCLLIASPGFVKDQFYSYMCDEAVKNDWKVILENKSRCVLAHSSSGFKHSLKEVLQDPSMANRLADTKALGEVKALDDFYNMLVSDADRAVYGIKPVEKASDLLAIETLMVSDELFRSSDIQKRQRYVTLVDKVKENGADVKIFSSLHVSGEQLGQLTGVAALLRYPIPEEDEVDEISDSEN